MPALRNLPSTPKRESTFIFDVFLISFDPDVVRPNSFGRTDFRRNGFRGGSCNLSCHEHDHIDSEY